MRAEVGKHGKLQKINKNKEKTKENPNKINTHTHRERMNTSSWTEKKRKEKKIQATDGWIQRWAMSYMKYSAQIFDPCASLRCVGKGVVLKKKKRTKQPS